jgi:hypothetical protein
MAKVELNNGMTVDALTFVKSNLEDYIERSRKLIEKLGREAYIETRESKRHRNDLVQLKNMIYSLSLDLEDLPIRKYKQNIGRR